MKKMEASLHVSEKPQSQRARGAGRIVNGGRRLPFIRLPKSTPSPEELAIQRKRTICQREIEESTVNLVKSTLGKLAKDENHAKKFKKEIDESTAVGALLNDHLGWVSHLPSTLQLVTLVGEKWLRSRI